MYNVLIIGYGNIAKRHINNLIALNAIKFLTVLRHSDTAIDDYPIASEQISALPTSDSLKGRFDFCIICSPTNSHIEYALQLLAAKIPCLIEKPLAMNAAEGKKLVSDARLQGTSVQVGYNLAFTKGFAQVLAVLQHKELGRIWRIDAAVGQYLPNWRPHKNYQTAVSANAALGGGVLLELSHELDYLLALFTPEKIAVQATLLNHSILTMDCENQAVISGSFNLADGLQAAIIVKLDMLQQQPSRYLHVYGELGVLRWDLILQQLVLCRHDGTEQVIDIKEDTNQQYISQLQHFLMIKNQANLDSLNTAYKTMRWIDAIRQSAAKGQTVHLELIS
ncbi:Gfo/Idh/MocA family protein [Pseudoalteromonas tunicata]|uniref:Oxidoreductase n=1 Tax=Pseudoalteromonas tunicata D2 TaxID=87626 RepID=A4C6E6_9GAMM|nr:Gfo/Idh/MocA family oxidoreductase [Pseudoalteromonas tunicata]ATC95525.1 hypothetical protein PTUN_a3143 [Pseudoalteromonas tunicata]AXT31097.1 gfo/Idh/MocA family oxidoreductase [Pseudoalteromonas tunicata]EAR29550.1 oxidoreductase [Pseudoalteromonas tunicata D2]